MQAVGIVDSDAGVSLTIPTYPSWDDYACEGESGCSEEEYEASTVDDTASHIEWRQLQ